MPRKKIEFDTEDLELSRQKAPWIQRIVQLLDSLRQAVFLALYAGEQAHGARRVAGVTPKNLRWVQTMKQSRVRLLSVTASSRRAKAGASSPSIRIRRVERTDPS